MDAEQREIRADHVHHRGDRALAEGGEPVGFGRVRLGIAELGGEFLGQRHQIVARIQALGHLAAFQAQRLAIAPVHRTREHIDLAACIVDIIFADHLVARIFEQGRERIADHRAAAMAHVHRPCRVGRDVFDVHRLARAELRASIIRPQRGDGVQFVRPDRGREAQVEKAGSGNLDPGDRIDLAQFRRQRLGQRTWIGGSRLGEHHRGIGCKVAMRRITRRLDGHGSAIEPRGERAGGFQRVERFMQMLGETGVECHDVGLVIQTPRPFRGEENETWPACRPSRSRRGARANRQRGSPLQHGLGQQADKAMYPLP